MHEGVLQSFAIESVSLPVLASWTSYTSVPFAMLSDTLFTVASSMTGALSFSFVRLSVMSAVSVFTPSVVSTFRTMDVALS
ncbi:hypothetical protein [Vibrio metoecus]|uniref:hypothetical protein n=1 Tax=Vibrio metoecus TaxID=1481663 RepID=UPI001302F0A6|nr:hypothetical protein [Vibrio metoecus]